MGLLITGVSIHGLKSGGTNHGEREERGAEGCGEGWLLPIGEEGIAMPPPQFFLDFWAQNGKFLCILGANFTAVRISRQA